LAHQQPRDRALRLLADAGDAGLHEAILVHVHGIAVDVLVELVNGGLACVTGESSGDRGSRLRALTITAKGREAIGKAHDRHKPA
jgi:hypothetical protein